MFKSVYKRFSLMPILLGVLALMCGINTYAVAAQSKGGVVIGKCIVPLDVAFVIDDTGSMGGAIDNIKNEIDSVVQLIQSISSPYPYQLALLTFKDDVTVRLAFSPNNDKQFIEALRPVIAGGGAAEPEASDVALQTAVDITPPPGADVIQIAILITDARPGGSDDRYEEGVDDVNAQRVALAARARGIKIGAIYVPTSDFYRDTIVPIMQDYAATTEGFYGETEPDGTGTAATIRAAIAQIACPDSPPPPPPPPIARRCPAKLFYASDTPQIGDLLDMGIFSMRPDGSQKTRLTSVPDPQRQRDLNPVVSPDGCWVAWERQQDNLPYEAWVMRHDGGSMVNITPPKTMWAAKPAWAYDNLRLALVADSGETAQLFTTDRNASQFRQLTSADAVLHADTPTWSPAEERIAFVNTIDTRPQIYTINSTGTDLDNLTRGDQHWNIDPRWSPVGAHVMYTRLPGQVLSDPGEIIRVNPAIIPNQRRFVRIVPSAEAYYPAWSRGGSHIAYVRQVGENRDLYVVDFDGSNNRRLTTDWLIDHRPAWMRFDNDTDPDQGKELPSPPETRLAVGSAHEGNFEVYSVPFLPGKMINLTLNPRYTDFRPHQ